ncbi:MAG: chemotaxis protein CheD [Deltaproteobacteria bacterium]|nr:chemotaxis protein CheD [Deltaproteobacteria bacterium]
MTNASNSPVPKNYFLKPGFIYVSTKPTMISTVVGSGIAVCVFDRRQKVGGMNHFQFPVITSPKQATARYGNVAVSALINLMIDEGSKSEHLEAQILGGAYNPEISNKNIGIDNIKIARNVLTKKRVRIVSEDVGGEKGRKIIFNTDSNEIAVVKVDKVRQEDWYPYEIKR